MGLAATSVALAVSTGVLGIAVVLDRRPYQPGKFNYVPLMIVSLAASLVLGRHLLGLIR